MVSTKLTAAITAFSVALSTAAAVFQLDPITLFMNTSLTYTFIRLGALAVLVSLLFIKPPRSTAMRAFLALSGVALHGWCVNTLLATSSVFDGFVFMAVAIVLEIEALKPQTVTAHESLRRLRA